MKNRFSSAALVPYTFVLMNWAVVTGLYHFARGFHGSWEPARANDIHVRVH
jgi:hypothetical protein